MSIEDVISATEAKFGSLSVMRLTEQRKKKIAAIRTGIPPLDLALGVGGLPVGRIIEISGPESSGKTTLALSYVAQAQKKGSTWAWIGDMEHALDPSWAKTLGVDLDKLLISQPQHGNECLDMAQHFAEIGVIDIIIIDSVAALVPQKELMGESGDAVMGLQARMMSQAMRKLTPVCSKNKCTAIFINQIREKIGVVYGSPETSPGGRALKFYASIRLDIRKTQNEKVGEDIVGSNHKITVKKNKVAPPFKVCEATLMFDKGFDFGINILYAGSDSGVIEKSGNTYSYKGEKIGVGIRSCAEKINDWDEAKKEELYTAIVGTSKKSKEEKEDSKKEKLAKYEKRLAEATTDEDKEKWKDKIEKIKAGTEIGEDLEEVGK